MEVSGYSVETFASGESLLQRNPVEYGCILLDVRMPGMDGLQVQEALKEQLNALPIIFLTAFGDVSRIVRAVKDGAEDYFIKPVDGDILLDRVHQVLKDFAIRVEIALDRKAFIEKLNDLTDREHEVLRLSVKGLSCKDIGLQLGLSHRTVELHRSHICFKVGIANFSELFRLGSKFGSTFD
jgi:FixJ family two-component response regulator